MVEHITYTTAQIMEQAQVFASAWSLVGGPFDSGNQLEAAKQEKAELAAMVDAHAAPQPTELPCEFAPEFRRALLWLLWNHQGGKSQVGQPIRAMLGIGQHDYLTDDELAEAKAYREQQVPAAQAAELFEVLELVTDCLSAAITGGQVSAAKAGSALVRASELLIKAKEAHHA